jgi:hypothetical protein
MQVALQQQQAARDYVLAKIEQVYAEQTVIDEKKRLQAARHRRRQLTQLKTKFQKALDQALSPQVQAGLTLTIAVEQRGTSKPRCLARFEFLGQRWRLYQQRGLFQSQWHLSTEDQAIATRCTSSKLEQNLCYVLGKYKHALGAKVRVLLLSCRADA